MSFLQWVGSRLAVGWQLKLLGQNSNIEGGTRTTNLEAVCWRSIRGRNKYWLTQPVFINLIIMFFHGGNSCTIAPKTTYSLDMFRQFYFESA